MNTLMLGNKAFARGLYEAGCGFVSSYPGTPSTEITEEAALYEEIYAEWAPNEKVATEAAFGASLAGKRSFCGMKHVGLNVAADPLFTLSYTGVNAGMVIGVADDAGMHSSQNEQDSRRYAVAAKIPMLEPADSQETIDFVKAAFEISEKFDTPVFVKMCTRVAHSQSVVTEIDRTELPLKPYEKNPQKYVMMPGYAKLKHPFVEERTQKLKEYAYYSELNRIESAKSDIGIITDSTSYQYVKEAFGDSVNILKLGIVNPLSDELLIEFAESVDKLYVVEELDPVITEQVLALGIELCETELLPRIDEFSQNKIRKQFGLTEPEFDCLDQTVPARPPVMCAGCPHRGMFYTLTKNKITVLGDIGCYTLGATAPLNAVDSTLCMGASVSGLHGFNKADPENEKRSVAVIGDSTFMHSGITGLVNMVYNKSASTVIILDNSITAMTGHQQNPLTGKTLKGEETANIDLVALVKAIGVKRVRVVDPYDLAECDKAVKEELNTEELSVIISSRPCVLLKTVKKNAPMVSDPDKCKSCNACMKLGCPAVCNNAENKTVIDATLCVGCGVCAQLCKFDAIVPGGKA